MTSIFERMEGGGRHRWYVVETRHGKPTIVSGPFRTRALGRVEVFKIAKAKSDPQPWPAVETFEGFPGFSVMRTGADVYYVGRASAIHDQGDDWADAICDYERAI